MDPANICLDKCILKTSWRCLSSSSAEDVFKTSWSRPIHFYWSYVFKTSSRRFRDVFKMLSRHIIILLTRFQDVFNTYSQSFWGVLKIRLSTEGFASVTLLRNLWSVYKICKCSSFSSFKFSLYYTFQWQHAEAYLESGPTLAIYSIKTPSQIFDWIENRLLAKGLKYLVWNI